MTDQQPHTPTVDELRRMYALKVPHDQRDRRNAEFDRFIAAAEQRKAIKAWDEGYQDGYSDGLSDGHPLGNMRDPNENPYRADQEADDD